MSGEELKNIIPPPAAKPAERSWKKWKRRIGLLAVLAIAAAAPALSFSVHGARPPDSTVKDPMGFGRFKWGMSAPAVRQELGAARSCASDGGDSCLQGPVAVALRERHAILELDADGGLYSITLDLRQSEFEEIRKLLRTKYGPGGSDGGWWVVGDTGIDLDRAGWVEVDEQDRPVEGSATPTLRYWSVPVQQRIEGERQRGALNQL